MSLCRNEIAGRSEHPEQPLHAEKSGSEASGGGAPIEGNMVVQRPTNGGGGSGGASAQAVSGSETKGWPSKKLPQNTRFFIMKSFCARDLKISMQKGIWATQQRNEAKLNQAFEVLPSPSTPSTSFPPLPSRAQSHPCLPRPGRPPPICPSLSEPHDAWATRSADAIRLQTADAVILFFSVNESRAFQGYAKMVAPHPSPSPSPNPRDPRCSFVAAVI